jgi:UDP-3-O-[3-hydroxymyristoyl] glucosamine N-acyltransferase
VHIGHNVTVGENTAMAAFVGIAGSTKIGKRCTFAGKVGVADNLVICDDAHFTGQSGVRTDIKEPGVYSSGVLLEESRNWLKNAMRFKQLNTLFKQVKDLSRNDSNK